MKTLLVLGLAAAGLAVAIAPRIVNANDLPGRVSRMPPRATLGAPSNVYNQTYNPQAETGNVQVPTNDGSMMIGSMSPNMPQQYSGGVPRKVGRRHHRRVRAARIPRSGLRPQPLSQPMPFPTAIPENT